MCRHAGLHLVEGQSQFFRLDHQLLQISPEQELGLAASGVLLAAAAVVALPAGASALAIGAAVTGVACAMGGLATAVSKVYAKNCYPDCGAYSVCGSAADGCIGLWGPQAGAVGPGPPYCTGPDPLGCVFGG